MRRQKYIVVFALIVLVWAIGIAGLVLWQTVHRGPDVETSKASYPSESSQYESPSSDHSQFGKLLDK